MYINIIKLFFGVWLFSYTIIAHASITCKNGEGGGPQTIYVNFGSITVPRNLAIGQLIYSGSFGSFIGDAVECGGSSLQDSYFANLLTYNNGKPDGKLAHVYDTNIEGVGIRVMSQNYPSSFSPYYDNPATMNGINYRIIDSVPVVIEMIKTGNIKSGTLIGGEIGEYYATDPAYNKVGLVTKIMMQGGNITQNSCSVTTSGLNFILPDVNANEFGSTVGYSPSATDTQNLGLECDANTNISATLSGVINPDLNDPSVLALTGQGGANVAEGVGIQLIYNGKPLKIDEVMELKTSPGGVESLPITARYYQTLNEVKRVGTANTSATLTLTYQ